MSDREHCQGMCIFQSIGLIHHGTVYLSSFPSVSEPVPNKIDSVLPCFKFNISSLACRKRSKTIKGPGLSSVVHQATLFLCLIVSLQYQLFGIC